MIGGYYKALPPANRKNISTTNDSNTQQKGKSIAKAAERAIASERSSKPKQTDTIQQQQPVGGSIAIRTQFNTVDVLGCNFMQAQERIQQMFSTSLMANRKTIYILHGHGSGGVLKSKIRTWLKQEDDVVKSFAPADKADGGDALTRVDLR